jgi:uncharacterized membrane protein (DUF2068 family)
MKQRSAALPTGVRLIVAYKFCKAVLQAAAAVALWVTVRAGFARTLARTAIALGDHAVHPLTVHLARWLGMVITPGHLHLVALLLGCDAVVSGVEGLVLRRGSAWGRWLVLASTSSLLPLEMYEIVHRPHLGRILVLLVNVAIVVYLASRVRAHRDAPLPVGHPRSVVLARDSADAPPGW